MSFLTKIFILSSGLLVLAGCVDDSKTYSVPGRYYSSPNTAVYYNTPRNRGYNQGYYTSSNGVRNSYPAPTPAPAYNRGYTSSSSRPANPAPNDGTTYYSKSEAVSSGIVLQKNNRNDDGYSSSQSSTSYSGNSSGYSSRPN